MRETHYTSYTLLTYSKQVVAPPGQRLQDENGDSSTIPSRSRQST